MIRAEGNAPQTEEGKRREVNFRYQASLILQTYAAMARPYGPTYVAQFLTADRFLQLRHPDHRGIGTMGRMSRLSYEQVVPMIHFLVDRGLLCPSSEDCITVELTAAGRHWLEQPQDMVVDKALIRFTQFERTLRRNLRNFRSEVSQRIEVKPWQVVSDYTLDRLVLMKPLDLDPLRGVPGMNMTKCEQFGPGLLLTIQDTITHYREFLHASLMVRINKGKYPYIKEMFMDGVTVPEMARLCGLKPNTVCGYLRDLHRAASLDLVPWIEATVNPKALFRACEYFEHVKNPTLREARGVLEMDYQTLLFARLYHQDKRLQAEMGAERQAS